MTDNLSQKTLSRTKKSNYAKKGVRHFLRSKQHSTEDVDKIIRQYNLDILKEKEISLKSLYLAISNDFNLFMTWYKSKN
jgi:hypothetical protein